MRAFPSTALRLVVAAALCSATLASFQPKTFRAAACPVEPPKPLRMLYVESERVVVARAGESRRVPGEHEQYQRRTIFDVSENLKGDPGENRIEVAHWVSEDAHFPGNFRGGETLLLFLKPNDEGSGYFVNDMRYGAKKLSDDALKVYVKRIEELAYIVSQPEPSKSELTEWLVRCAEEPATRWEGAYELATSRTIAEYEVENKKEEALVKARAAASASEGSSNVEAASDEREAVPDGEDASTESAEAAPGDETVAAETGEEVVVTETLWGFGTDIDASIAAGLNEEQKKRLADALFSADKLGEGEMALVQLVKNWEDERFAPFVLNYLRGVEEDPPYQAAEMLTALAYGLKDDSLIKLSTEYIESAPYYDEEEEVSESDETSEVDEAAEVAEGGEIAVETEETPAPEEEDEAAPQLLQSLFAPDGTKLTATQRRSQMLRNFLSAVESRMSEKALLSARQ